MKGKCNPRHLVALALAFALAGCGVNSTSTASTDNPEVKVERLFRFDGCTVYRFTDYGNAVHYAKCGRDSTVSEQRACGKNCRHEVTVETNGSDE